MTTLKELKKYLVGNGGYLLNDDNNGKTVMLSGAWGSGKTHFWLEDIKPQLVDKEQKNIYISLYGKESIGELKFEVLREAYNLEVKEDFISKTASMISSIAPSLGEKSLVDGFDKLNKKAKDKKAKEILQSGSIICLDDFERKSKNIDLNDLFGYISQLALDYNCKVVIILNSDVFEAEEANVFKTVKEKTVNKFFYFEPTIEELFNSIYESNEKYKKLDDYRDEILKAIEETEELNARIYIHVLDNCLEWMTKMNDKSSIKTLIFVTMNFVINHIILDYKKIKIFSKNSFRSGTGMLEYDLFSDSPPAIRSNTFSQILAKDENEYISECKKKNDFYYVHEMQKLILEKKKDGSSKYSPVLQEECFSWIDINREELCALWKYGYRLYTLHTISEEMYNKISNYVSSGIIL